MKLSQIGRPSLRVVATPAELVGSPTDEAMDSGRETSDDLELRFRHAASYISSLSSDVFSVPDRLRLYGLYKLVTTINGPPPSASSSLAFWDFEGKAKSESWRNLRKELESKASLLDDGQSFDVVSLAAIEYIDRAKQAGWSDPAHSCRHPNDLGSLRERLENCLTPDDSELAGPEHSYSHQSIQPSTSNHKQQKRSGTDEGHQVKDADEEDDLSHSDASSENSHKRQNHTDHFSMVSVSKMLPIDHRLFLKQTSDPFIDEPASRLHDLVLDRDEDGLERYLEEIAQADELSQIINRFHNGYTPFHLACDQGNLRIVKCLLKFGADDLLRDINDELPGIELAQEAGMTHVVEFLANR
ncbi:hypothetical protein O181_002631 [Austropuccinia psidii MF-1]|uniref:ACB domain-containing protein n=1 Tax=Austropuccinia psidii MF-1 TaxID=1389203 RepID=A0A9Q3BC96_9BASI|nr:hypothetical protein [Austropuccinia psidii MF-1]